MSGYGLDYFENSRRATLAQRAYCSANPKGFKGYSDSLWGITASDVQGGYTARGAPPAQGDDGTLNPTAPGRIDAVRTAGMSAGIKDDVQ
jgi:hypothetical protein